MLVDDVSANLVLRVEVSTLRRSGFEIFKSEISNLVLFDNRIATLKQNTQGKFYCASVLKDSRVSERESKKMADDSSASSLNYQIPNS
jgi:hypothetical protein